MTAVAQSRERLAWLRLARTEGVGALSFHRLIERCGSAEAALEDLPGLSRRGGRKQPLIPPAVSAIEDQIAAMDKAGIGWMTSMDPDYPPLLGAIEDAPPVITFIGHTHLMTRPGLAMVGARNASLNGRNFARALAEQIGREGYTLISGMAAGIDTAAHEGSLASGTIAVLAGGADIVYPKANHGLYEQICAAGLVLAEEPPGTQPTAQHFPRRNRIISGLALGTAVIEATARSGSLITARLANEQGREVFAVPGHPADPRAEGPIRLLKDGAHVLEHAGDVVEILNRQRSYNAFAQRRLSGFREESDENFGAASPDNAPAPEDILEAPDVQYVIMAQLSSQPVPVDDLIDACSLTPRTALAALLELELAGRLQRHPGNRVSL